MVAAAASLRGSEQAATRILALAHRHLGHGQASCLASHDDLTFCCVSRRRQSQVSASQLPLRLSGCAGQGGWSEQGRVCASERQTQNPPPGIDAFDRIAFFLIEQPVGDLVAQIHADSAYASGQLALNPRAEAARMVSTNANRWTPCQTPSRPVAGDTMQN